MRLPTSGNRRGIAAARIALATAAAVLSAGVGVAAAGSDPTVTTPPTEQAGGPQLSTGETTTDTRSLTTDSTSTQTQTSATSSDSGGTGSATTSGLRVALADATPSRSFFYSGTASKFRYRIRGTQSRNLMILVVRRGSGKVIRAYSRDHVEPGVNHRVLWNGRGRNGNVAAKGSYRYRIETQSGTAGDTDGANGDDTFRFYVYKFPVRGPHSYGDGVGAPRSGHVHQGQDIAAACGTRLVAARGGRVQYRAYQAGDAGNYLVVDGRGTGKDFVYMHLMHPALVGDGDRVHTGQRIGYVGETGDATGCHLHFEMWSSPGWYEGGHYMDPLPYLKDWDQYS
jgi:murein DD-endopeptidase MepM/ murein hydrolase activator NlpD